MSGQFKAFFVLFGISFRTLLASTFHSVHHYLCNTSWKLSRDWMEIRISLKGVFTLWIVFEVLTDIAVGFLTVKGNSNVKGEISRLRFKT